MRSVLIVLGTRPEAVKLAPVIVAARAFGDWRVRVCATGQHRELLPSVLRDLDVAPDLELTVMRAGQGVGALLEASRQQLGAVVDAAAPDAVVAQGDTTTALAAALVARQRGLPLAHVEAGLRTGDLRAPFPEEANRVLIGALASLHLAPTPRAVANLRAEGVPAETIVLTGNTVVDAVRHVLGRVPVPSPRRPIVLVTGHRREAFGGGLAAVCTGIASLAAAHPETTIAYPLHLNPAASSVARRHLSRVPNVALLPPLPYAEFVALLAASRFVITDSGGIQEEAAELGKPVLVTRPCTERPEAVELGHAVVVGYDPRALLSWGRRWLADREALRAATPRVNPFGDGRAGPRCAAAIRRMLGLAAPRQHAWSPPTGVEPATGILPRCSSVA